MNFNHLKPETITAYLAQDLSARDKFDVDSHVSVCPACAAKIDRQRREREKIAKAFQRPPESGMILSSADRSAIDAEIGAGLKTDSASARTWTVRIRRSLLIQILSILLAGGILALLLFLPRPEKKAVPAEIPSPAAPPVAVSPAQEPVPETSEDGKPAPATREVFFQSPELVAKLGLDRIPTVPEGKGASPLITSVTLPLPFASGLYIVYADSIPGEKAAVSVEIIPPEEMPPAASLRPGGTENAHCILLNPPSGTELPPMKLSLHCITADGTVRNASLPVLRHETSFSAAPARVRLAALLMACSSPHLLLDKNARAEILHEFDILLAGEYAVREDVRRLAEWLRKIK